jgi:hypothetical protein
MRTIVAGDRPCTLADALSVENKIPRPDFAAFVSVQ